MRNNCLEINKNGINKRLKILLVPDYLPWILGTWCKEIVKYGKNHDYYFFSQQMFEKYTDDWEKLVKTVDVVHFLNQWGNKCIQLPGDMPLVTSVHHIVDEIEWQEQLLPLNNSSAVIVVSKEWKRYLIKRGIQEKYIYLFYNGVDTDKFYKFSKDMAKKRIGINSKTKLIGFSAKYSSDYGGRKGIDVFIKSIKILLQQGTKFEIVVTGPNWEKAIKEIEDCGIIVHYLPFISDKLMPSFFNALDIYICTSRIEGGPAPIIESMACGTPVVTTPVGHVIDYLVDRKTVLIVPKGDAQKTAAAISELIKSKYLYDSLSLEGLKTINDNFKWEKTLDGIEHLYSKIYLANCSREKKSTSTEIDAATQRKWALSVDYYLWYEGLFYSGYLIEGIIGISRSIIRLRSLESFFLTWDFLISLLKNIINKIRRR